MEANLKGDLLLAISTSGARILLKLVNTVRVIISRS